MSLAVTLKQYTLDAIFGRQTYTSVPNSLWFGLLTPDDAELVDGGYVRVEVINNVSNFPAATFSGTNGIKTCAASITFPVATVDWALVSQLAVYAGSSGRTPLLVLSLLAETTIKAGGQLVIAADSIQITQP